MVKNGEVASVIAHFPQDYYNDYGECLEHEGNINIYTFRKWRGQGVATQLLKYAESVLYIRPYDHQALSPSGYGLIAKIHPELV